MAGYPPQQRESDYAAHHHAGPPSHYPVHQSYPVHPHHAYGPPMPPGAGPYPGPFPPGPGGPNGSNGAGPGPMHSQGPMGHRGPPMPNGMSEQQQHFEQGMPPGMHGIPQPGGPSMPRAGPYGGNIGPPPQQPHPQQMQHHHQGQPMFAPQPPPREYHMQHQAPPPPPPQHQHQQPLQKSASQQSKQSAQQNGRAATGQSHSTSHAAKSGPATGSAASSKRGGATSSTKEAGGRGGAKSSGLKKAGKSAATKKEAAAAAAAAGAPNAANDRGQKAAAAAHDDPVQDTKKIRKRKEVVERIHRVHFDTIENRDILYNDMQHAFAATAQVLLLSPGLSRPYLLALNRLTLERDADLRQSALLHAHQVESARIAYEQDRTKIEDEARNAKRAVRERLLSAVEDRRRRLREDKESGEGTSDALLETSSRQHATRKLRNKVPGGRGDVEIGAGLTARGRAAAAAAANAGTDAEGDGASTPRGNGGGAGLNSDGAHPLLGSLLEFSGFGAHGQIAALPPSNFDIMSSSAAAASLLHIGVGGGMGDSSYMSGFRAAMQSTHNKGKKKSAKSSGGVGGGAGGKPTGAIGATGAADLDATNINSAGGDDDDDEGNARSLAAAAAAAVAAATMLNGTGRLRWDAGKSVGQLTSARDIEIESDLINIRKVSNKRRRR